MVESKAKGNPRNSIVTAKFNEHKRGCDGNKWWGISVVIATDRTVDGKPLGIITAFYWKKKPSDGQGA